MVPSPQPEYSVRSSGDTVSDSTRSRWPRSTRTHVLWRPSLPAQAESRTGRLQAATGAIAGGRGEDPPHAE